MSPSVLSARQINRAVLHRQLLLERADLDIPTTLQRVGGLQTQYAPSGYIGLWTRLVDFERASLTRALEDRSVVQATLMRTTIHMVAAGDFWPICAAIRESRRDWWLRIAKSRQLPAIPYDDLADVLRDALAEGPRPRVDIVAAMEQAVLGGCRIVDRHGQGAAVGYLGASPGRSIRSGRAVGSAHRGLRSRWSSPVVDPLPPGVRSGSARRCSDVGGRAASQVGTDRSGDGSGDVLG